MEGICCGCSRLAFGFRFISPSKYVLARSHSTASKSVWNRSAHFCFNQTSRILFEPLPVQVKLTAKVQKNDSRSQHLFSQVPARGLAASAGARTHPARVDTRVPRQPAVAED